VALAVLLVLAGLAIAEDAPHVTVTIAASEPRPDPEDSQNLLGRRHWEVDFRVSVSSDRTCDRLGYAYRTRDLFDGRLGLHRTYAGSDTRAAAQTANWTIQGTGGAGDTINLWVRASCIVGGSEFHSTPASVRATIPPHSCNGGPLRVSGLTGHAWREHLDVLNRRLPLYLGHYLWEPYTAWLGRRARIEFGARECGGFRIALRGPGEFYPGSYERRGRGGETTLGRGMLARFLGDRHAGGIATESARITTAGTRVATFDVYSYPAAKRTRVSVLRGTARVSGKGARSMSSPVFVHSGYVTTVRCSSPRACAPDLPRRR
jgi:hypothetical protein